MITDLVSTFEPRYKARMARSGLSAVALLAVISSALPCVLSFSTTTFSTAHVRPASVHCRNPHCMVAMKDGDDASPPMNKAKRNALAANRLQWGISGGPAKVDYSADTSPLASQDTDVGASVPVAESTGDSSSQNDMGRLGAKMDEIVRQALAKAAAVAEKGSETVMGSSGKASTTQRLQLPGFQLASLGFKGGCCLQI